MKVENTISMLLLLLEIINTLLFCKFSFYGKGTLPVLLQQEILVLFKIDGISL